MKKLFQKRARVVVYVEYAELVEMTAAARAEGKTLVEWARGRLRSEEPERLPKRQKISKTAPPPTDESDLAMPEEQPAVIGSAASPEKCEHGAVLNCCKEWGCMFYEHSNGRGAVKRNVAPDTPRGTRVSGGKCTWLPKPNQKCPRCGKVHSNV